MWRMNQENLKFLQDRLFYLGTEKRLHPELEKNMAEGKPEFKLSFSNHYDKDKLSAELHFRKSDTNDMYFINKYDATLQKPGQEARSQTFYLDHGKGVTMKEAYNLLDGRSVHKDLKNKEGEVKNDLLVRELKKFTPRPGMVEVYVPLLQKAFNDQTMQMKNERGQILMQIEDMNNRLKNARNLFADGKMDQRDYRDLRDECQPKINMLEGKLSGFMEVENNINGILKTAVQNMTWLDKSYLGGSIQKKRQIIGSIFPEKLSFDKAKGRTGRINEAVRLIYKLDKVFMEIKKPDSGRKMHEPGEVTPLGLEPRTQRLRVFCSTN
jgi:hypothetical protein